MAPLRTGAHLAATLQMLSPRRRFHGHSDGGEIPSWSPGTLAMRPLVLVHGLWDTPRLFVRLVQHLDQPERPLLIPHLPHGLGVVPLRQLASQLDRQIQDRFGAEVMVDLLGFSMCVQLLPAPATRS